MLLIDSYYNDLKIDNNKILLHDAINTELLNIQYLWTNKTTPIQTVLTEDDVKDICDYIAEVLGANAVNITHSNFRKIVAPKFSMYQANIGLRYLVFYGIRMKN